MLLKEEHLSHFPNVLQVITMVTEEFLARIRNQYVLDWHGIHGIHHWRRVNKNGLRLAIITQANPAVVELFAFLHDSRRFNEGTDPDHGRRAAVFAKQLRGTFINLPDYDFELLVFACRYHTEGLTEANVTVQTCWDADRLDLGRVGKRPKANYLCTEAAKDSDIIEWAYQRSLGTRIIDRR